MELLHTESVFHLSIVGVISLCASIAVAEENIPQRGAPENVSIEREYPVAETDLQWYDARRLRQVPVKIYYPVGDDGSLPVVLFSHGLGRSRFDCAYLGRHWASHGYFSVFVEHAGSDETVWRGKIQPIKNLKEAYEDPKNMRNRPLDMRFVLNNLVRLQRKHDPLAARLDLTRVGAAGFDWGAQTVLALAGQVLPGGFVAVDHRVSAVIAMSPPVSLGQVPLEVAYGGIEIPCLYMTGNEDDGIIGTTKAYQRRLPFDYTFGADQYLVTFQGADHMIYAGHIFRQREMEKDARFQPLIRDASTLFWDAYLQGKPEAIMALRGRGLNKLLGQNANVEKKIAASDNSYSVSRDP